VSTLFLERAIPDVLQDIRTGGLSFKALADEACRVVAKREPDTLAWVGFDADGLRSEAERAWARYQTRGTLLGLDGIPFGVKDIFNTRAFPTQMGSPIWKDFTPGNDARVVDSLVKAGALVAGKTVTAEFAVHALNETFNPHDPATTPGTSSSGSAAAVAAGMVPFALGTQTAGSIVRPASFCGIWAMKPSFGLIPRTGVLKTTDSLDTIGFLTAHAKSLRPILDEVRVKGPDYPFVYRNVDANGSWPKLSGAPWRVGFVKTHTWNGAADYARAAIETLAHRIGCEPGFEVTELNWPEGFEAAHSIHSTIYTKSLSYYFQNEAKQSVDVSPIMTEMIVAGQTISVDVFRTALRQQEGFSAALDRLLDGYDFVLSLATSTAAPPRGCKELPDPSLIWTLGHIPAITAPSFRSPVGLPFGAQFIARRWADYRLLQGIEELVDRGVLPAGSQPIIRWCSLLRTAS
jgi:Asp-tRNA(Asn)/Glu-tRNA(Gln) amidotransferase A subunit family amidase